MDSITKKLARVLRGYMATHRWCGDETGCDLCMDARATLLRAENPTDPDVDRLLFDLEVMLRERREAQR